MAEDEDVGEIPGSGAVPPWLHGVWGRDWIQRASGPGEELGPQDSSVEVQYVQTPWAFVDIRRPRDAAAGAQGVLAFGGVATVGPAPADAAPSTRGAVSWHACLDFEKPEADPAAAWAAAETGTPLATEDVGLFAPEGGEAEDAWIEEDPDRTLRERWLRRHDGADQFLAAKKRGSTALFVLAGESFALACDERRRGGGCQYVAGELVDGRWRVRLSAADRALEGTELALPGVQEEWTMLPGSSVGWTDLMDDSGRVAAPTFTGIALPADRPLGRRR